MRDVNLHPGLAAWAWARLGPRPSLGLGPAWAHARLGPRPHLGGRTGLEPGSLGLRPEPGLDPGAGLA